ncbi:MAG: hypothetical protein ACJAVK_001149 [Akkermansiaceae bacterium]|jgi:hypothetical protein
MFIQEHPFLTANTLLAIWFTWEFYRRYQGGSPILYLLGLVYLPGISWILAYLLLKKSPCHSESLLKKRNLFAILAALCFLGILSVLLFALIILIAFAWGSGESNHYFVINLVLLSTIYAFSFGIHRCSITCEDLYLKNRSY